MPAHITGQSADAAAAHRRAGALLLCALLVAASAAAAPQPPALAELPALTAADRVLVIAPHPDDETLCCAGLLQRAVQAGATVGVLWVTAGDSFEIDAIVTERTLRPRHGGMARLGLRRLQEAHAAADRLGVPRSQQYVLGYADRSVGALLDGDGERVLRSSYTGVDAVPYADAQRPGARYTGNNLRADFAAVLARFAPTIVLAPAPQDRHADHRACGALARAALAAQAPDAQLYYWIVHAGAGWPRPHGLHAVLPLAPPRSAAALPWRQMRLSAAERSGKREALRCHRTQLAVMPAFLYSFVRANELYASAP